jgi:hypothetical protein
VLKERNSITALVLAREFLRTKVRSGVACQKRLVLGSHFTSLGEWGGRLKIKINKKERVFQIF